MSGNPLAMTAGLETLKLMTPERYEELEEKGAYLEAGLRQNAEKYNIPHTINRVGSMVGFFFNEGPVTNFEEASGSDLKRFARYFQLMAEQGIYIPPSQFEGMFLSIAHTQEDLDRTIAANEQALAVLSRE